MDCLILDQRPRPKGRQCRKMDEGPAKQLSEALHVVQQQSHLMRRHLEGDLLMDALKAASTMLAELRTSVLGPKQYYELYMAVTDGLRYLSSYLHEAHLSEKQDLAELYELVQYAGNIVSRPFFWLWLCHSTQVPTDDCQRRAGTSSLPDDHCGLCLHECHPCSCQGNHERHDGNVPRRAASYPRPLLATLSFGHDPGPPTYWSDRRVSSDEIRIYKSNLK